MTTDKREVIGNYEVVEGKLKTRREVLLMGALAAGGALVASGAKASADTVAAALPGTAAGTYKAKDFSSLISKPMEGLNPQQIEPHIKLYQGYVTKANEIQGWLNTVDLTTPAPNATYHPFRELLMEQSYAHNGVVYHEMYFGNLGGPGGEPGGQLKSAIEGRWGSNGKFMDKFTAAGKCMRGWVIVGWNTRVGQLEMFGLDLHNMWVPANFIPVVVLDVYEHAYMIEYGTNRGAYLDAFMKNVDWAACEKRLVGAIKHPSGADTTA